MTIGNNNNICFKIANRVDFICSYHIDIINNGYGRYANEPDLIILQYTYLFKSHIVPYKYIILSIKD